MNRFAFFWILTLLLMANPVNAQVESDSEDILIVYLSRTGNTEAVAEMIRDEVGGDLVELELETPYPENYDEIVSQVARENETEYLPPLNTEIENIGDYYTIFVGFPTWDMQLPPPMKSFLNEYDLSGKTLIPFNTNGGYGLGSSIRQIEELCLDSTILESFSVRGGLERDGIYLDITGDRREEVRSKAMEWLRNIGMK
jgi:flavodoxin